MYRRKLGGTVEIKVGDAWIGTSFPIALLLLAANLPAAARHPGGDRRAPPLAAAHAHAPRDEAPGGGRCRGDPDPDRARRRHRRGGATGGAQGAQLPRRHAADPAADRRGRTAFGPRGGGGGAFRLLAQMRRCPLPRAARPAAAGDAARRLGRRRRPWRKEAETVQPGAAWLREERPNCLQTRDWREALALPATELPKPVLALAAAAQEPDPVKAADSSGRPSSSTRASSRRRWRMPTGCALGGVPPGARRAGGGLGGRTASGLGSALPGGRAGRPGPGEGGRGAYPPQPGGGRKAGCCWPRPRWRPG